MESRVRRERQHLIDTIGGLDLPTKVGLLTGASMFSLRGEPGIGLTPIVVSDGPTGVRGPSFEAAGPSVLLPNATVLASTWDEDRLGQVGRLLAAEAQRLGVHVVLGPTVNLHRSPLGGRVFEQFSEDPLLTGRLAAAYVRGLQGQGIGACLKHLVANESERDRAQVDSVLSERALRELYLLPFEIAVDESDPWAVMAAYNKVNGVPATEQHHVNVEILRERWSYWGLLMSDWYATGSSAPAVLGGLDLVMPGPDGPWGQALIDDVEAGRVPEAEVDQHLKRVLWLAHRVGALSEHTPYPVTHPAPDSDQRRTDLRAMAAAGFTLLRNENHLLPLADPARIAVIGRHAVRTVCQGGGSAQVTPPHEVSIADGLSARPGQDVTVVDGVPVRFRPVPADPAAVTDPGTGQPGVHVLVRAGDGTPLRDGPSTAARISPEPGENEAASAVFTARLTGQGPHEVGVLGTGTWTLRVDGQTLHTGTLTDPGTDPGGAVLDPPAWTTRIGSGSLLEAVWERDENAPLRGLGTKALVAAPVETDPQAAIDAAVAAAAGADVAVVVVGLTPDEEREGRDKTTLALPGEQDAMVRAVAAAAPRTVVVVNAATPVLMPWEQDVDAVLVVGLPGQEGGHAVADVLFGDAEPAGRLVTSWPAADGDAPAWSLTPGPDATLPYTEDLYPGYRGHHAGRAPAPAHWFGEGLGYGTWVYGEALQATGIGTPSVVVDIKNTSTRDSREVVQLYFAPEDPDEPVRLVGWAGVTVEAGMAARVLVTSEGRLWRRWNQDTDDWDRLPVRGEFIVARGLGDVRARISPS